MGLRSLQFNNEAFAEEIRMINSIAFVPEEKIEEAWLELKTYLTLLPTGGGGLKAPPSARSAITPKRVIQS